jgi:threonine dehydrogenase-like Zn-dependent dehydrogenase
MRALAILSPGVARIVERAAPEPGPGEVLVRVRRVGLCGSDLNTFRGKNPMVSYPRVLGHEVSGVVEAVGPGVPPRWRPGVPVTFDPYKSCGACPSCRAGRTNACRANQTLGVQRDGALAELVVVPAGKLHSSDTLSLEELALVEPFSVGFHAVARGRVGASDTVLVMGVGGVGLGAVAGAAARGARVIALDLDETKLALSRVVGASETLDGRAGDAHQRLLALTGGDGPDVIIEAVGAVETYRQAVDWVAYAGRVVYIGYGKEPVAYETKQFVAKELDILGARNALGEPAEVISCFERRLFDPRTLVSRTVELDEAPAALTDWAERPAATSKILVAL